jgi:hypothetical protein
MQQPGSSSSSSMQLQHVNSQHFSQELLRACTLSATSFHAAAAAAAAAAWS